MSKKERTQETERGRGEKKEEAVNINVKCDSKITGERQQVKLEVIWIPEPTTP